MEMGADTFRIVQFSDLHLTAKEGDRRSEPKLFGKLQDMNKAFITLAGSQTTRESDWILFTGDITDNGSLEAWAFFWDVLERFDLKKKSTIIPGNHDMCCLGARLSGTRRQHIAEDLTRLHNGLAMGGCPATKYPYAVRLNDRIAVFAIDSCNKGNSSALTNAMGHIGNRQLERFARLLYKFRETRVKIVILHHSPNIPGNSTAARRGLEKMGPFERWGMEMPAEDRRALRLLCTTHRVRLVLHGHLHRKEDRRINGVRYIGAPASTQPQDGRYAFFTYDVTQSGSRVMVKLAAI